ncbi:uncharacterized protein BP01DRAFT_391365 [Aspergillus saccharolyticus JOP 1030-1]|uniref:Uncharacterized protein n=1 Tax=Aspergillus saccharolyticus JOP 1030-1 TaxID=1450539 RepID=A0A318ZEQ6_9EURO|nr:hypothetical protein BP01DRAFT_391365 [Aspergillus saccharolyticus JOP 1030-1]PYH46026.1 hypothetical protein BP01DRAFT_391365 [Aspergillus saccharolyticus JOP 1030-1]
MRFIIPLTLLLTSLVLGAPTADPDTTNVEAAADAAAPADEFDIQRCRRGCIELSSCQRGRFESGGKKGGGDEKVEVMID